MSHWEPTPDDRARHEQVYATPGLPPFAVHGLDDVLLSGRNPLTTVDVARLRDLGVTHVLDLREDHEWQPPRFGAEAIAALAHAGIERRSVVVQDIRAPTPAAFDEALAWIDTSLERPGALVYVHCRAGRERTGSILAAYIGTRTGVRLEHAVSWLHTRCATDLLPEQYAATRTWLTQRPGGTATDLRARVRGCLLGGAIGDALGAGVEFASLRQIREEHGPAGVTDYVPAYRRRGAITDDTQMTLFSAEAMIRTSAANRRSTARGTAAANMTSTDPIAATWASY